jgi:hypothetical protein
LRQTSNLSKADMQLGFGYCGSSAGIHGHFSRLKRKKLGKSRVARGIQAGPFSDAYGTEVLYAEACPRFILLSEQFWGRAARASLNSKEFRDARHL